jgi:hypothetical protein
VAGGLLVALAFFSGTGFFFVLSLHLQEGLGFGPLASGLTFLPFPVGVVLGSGVSVALLPRLGRTLVSLGGVGMVAGVGTLAAAATWSGTGLQGWHLAPGLAVAGVGMAMVSATLVNLVLAAVPERDAGTTSGLVHTAIQVGNAAAVAGAGTLFFSLLDHGLGSVQATSWTLAGELALFVVSVALSFTLPEAARARPSHAPVRAAA